MPSIPLYGRDGLRAHTRVDDTDYEIQGQFRWQLSTRGYASRFIGSRGRQRALLLHREILGLTHGDGLVGDHINRDRLDNRRINLRTLDLAVSAQNVSMRGGTSRYRGVHWDSKRQKWFAQGSRGGKRVALGRFDDEDEAGRAASEFRAAYQPYLTNLGV
jgi:hypothetical protein